MRKLLILSVIALLVMPAVFAAGIGSGIGGTIGVEEFPPIVWQCDNRVLTDEEIQPWRCTDQGDEMFERANNYLFDGEKYQVDVVVFDKNKVDELAVDLILGQDRGDADYNVNCVEIPRIEDFKDCNARIGEEKITTFDDATMQAYRCTITALDSEHMAGPYWLTVQADDGTNEPGFYDEATPLYINPVIELAVDGSLDFSDVRPGTASYSQVSVENNAEGGVALDMFITGKDWPAADSVLGRCQQVDGTTGLPITGSLVNYLSLGAFRYYAENGAYSTRVDALDDSVYSSVIRAKDAEGYLNINKQLNAGFEEAMFNDAEIIQAGGPVTDIATCKNEGYRANVLNPGAKMALTFRLMLPEPCYGEFESAEDGSVFIWAEAI